MSENEGRKYTNQASRTEQNCRTEQPTTPLPTTASRDTLLCHGGKGPPHACSQGYQTAAAGHGRRRGKRSSVWIKSIVSTSWVPGFAGVGKAEFAALIQHGDSLVDFIDFSFDRNEKAQAVFV